MARIAVDLNGGDFGPSITLPASLQFFLDHPDHTGVLVGTAAQTSRSTSKFPKNIEFFEASVLGGRAQKPSRLLRQEGSSSIEVAFNMLAQKTVDVVVSAEHTGVLMALISKYGSLHSLVDRPVLASWLPTLARSTLMLDLGASFNASHEQLLTYAAIGSGLADSKVGRPALGLLNVGTEFFKGPAEIRLASTLLSHWESIDYRGFVEASDVFKGHLDIIVCDGFTGNSVIKASEGAVSLFVDVLKSRSSRTIIGRCVGWGMAKVLKRLEMLDPGSANGALFAGSDLHVVKSHGNAQTGAFYAAIGRALQMCEEQSSVSVWNALDRLLDQGFEFG